MSASISLKEKAIFATLIVVVLYAAVAVFWFLVQEKAWRKAGLDYRKKVEKYEREVNLISKKNKYASEYDDEKSRMPMFSFEAHNTDTTWLRKMDDFAAKYNVVIAQTDIGPEEAAGDVLERTITVRNFEGSLEALVKFMYELENSETGMFDMKSLNLKPSQKKGYLKGSFTITCAYMRTDNQEEAEGELK